MTDQHIEELAALCLERLETEGMQAFEELCRQQPEHAERLRGIVRQLRQLGLLRIPRDREMQAVPLKGPSP